MPFDEALANRVRPRILAEGGVEKKMFGGLAYLIDGNMSVGVNGNELIVRIDPGETDWALGQPGVRIFDITGRPMKGWLMVSPKALASDSDLEAWVQRGIGYARSLPPK